MQPRVSPNEGQLQITLLQERSTGTFARVYLAEARGSGGLSRVVAVKVLKEQWSDSHEILTRTRDEARLLSRLQHRNILRVEALAEVDGQPAMVMEFVDGLDLQQLIERLAEAGRRVPRRSVYAILAAAASALASAWEEVPVAMEGPLRVVHRDIKPSNVMVSRQGEVKVLDFGTARFDFTERQASTGALRFGSLKYMAPERRRGDRGEHGSDVYALGLVAVELLQGRLLPVLPVDPGEHDDAIAQALDGLHDLGLPDRRWDDALQQTLLGMLATDPARRLHASQVVPLFRSFADNATGESLESFAAGTVSELTRQVYGAGPRPGVAGARSFVALTTSSDLPPPSNTLVTGHAGLQAHRTMVPDDDLLAEVEPPPEDPAFADADHPTQISGPALGPDVADGPTQVTGRDDFELPTEVDGHAPPLARPAAVPRAAPLPVAAAPADTPFPEPESVTRPTPPPFAAPAAAAPVAAAPAAAAPAAAAPADAAPAGRSNLAVAFIAGVVVFLVGGAFITFAVAALGLWFYFQQPERPALAGASEPAAGDQRDDPLAALDDTPEAPPADAATYAVAVSIDDDMLQWTAIEDGAGARLFKGSPGGEVQLPPGEYVLLAKVRARSTVSAPLAVQQGRTLRCASAEKGEVHCEDDAGARLVLGP